MKLGMKIRYNEPPYLDGFKPGMIELHLSDADLYRNREEIIDAMSILPDIPIVIHSPISLLMKTVRPPLVDLASMNEKLRNMGLDVVRKTMELMGDIDAEYIIIHPGSQTPTSIKDHSKTPGNITHGEPSQIYPKTDIAPPPHSFHTPSNINSSTLTNRFHTPSTVDTSTPTNSFHTPSTVDTSTPTNSFHTPSTVDTSALTSTFTQNLIGSLKNLEEDYNTKEMLIENMPLHHWMWGEEECWRSNLLRTPEEFEPILEYVNITLDICHAYLAVEGGSNDIIFDFLRKLRRWIKHVHLSDASAPDKEGLQFGDGEIELRKVFRAVLDLDATAIHEIRGGHLNDREGMKEANRRFNAILLGHEYR